MIFFVLIVAATLLYTLFDVFASRSSGKIDPNMGAAIFNGLGAILPMFLYLYYKSFRSGMITQTTSEGLWYASGAGVSIAIFSILLIKIFERGGLAYVVPLIYGGTVILAPLLGWLFFKEHISPLQLAGICVIAIGIGMVVVSQLQTHS